MERDLVPPTDIDKDLLDMMRLVFKADHTQRSTALELLHHPLLVDGEQVLWCIDFVVIQLANWVFLCDDHLPSIIVNTQHTSTCRNLMKSTTMKYLTNLNHLPRCPYPVLVPFQSPPTCPSIIQSGFPKTAAQEVIWNRIPIKARTEELRPVDETLTQVCFYAEQTLAVLLVFVCLFVFRVTIVHISDIVPLPLQVSTVPVLTRLRCPSLLVPKTVAATSLTSIEQAVCNFKITLRITRHFFIYNSFFIMSMWSTVT